MGNNITIEVNVELLANIHNAISRMHPTGDDIVAAAAVMMDIRKVLEEMNAEPVPEETEADD